MPSDLEHVLDRQRENSALDHPVKCQRALLLLTWQLGDLRHERRHIVAARSEPLAHLGRDPGHSVLIGIPGAACYEYAHYAAGPCASSSRPTRPSSRSVF